MIGWIEVRVALALTILLRMVVIYIVGAAVGVALGTQWWLLLSAVNPQLERPDASEMYSTYGQRAGVLSVGVVLAIGSAIVALRLMGPHTATAEEENAPLPTGAGGRTR